MCIEEFLLFSFERLCILKVAIPRNFTWTEFLSVEQNGYIYLCQILADLTDIEVHFYALVLYISNKYWSIMFSSFFQLLYLNYNISKNLHFISNRSTYREKLVIQVVQFELVSRKWFPICFKLKSRAMI